MEKNQAGLIGGAFSFAFRAFLAHIGFFLSILFFSLMVTALIGIICSVIFLFKFAPALKELYFTLKTSNDQFSVFSDLLKDIGPVMIFIIIISCLFLLILKHYIMLGLTNASFAIYDNKPVTYQLFFSSYRFILTDLIASVLYYLICSIGLLLLIFPGIYLAIACMLYQQDIVDKNASSIESLKTSYAITKGHKWELLGIILIFWVMNAISVKLFFGIPLLLLTPIHILVLVYVYRHIYKNPTHIYKQTTIPV